MAVSGARDGAPECTADDMAADHRMEASRPAAARRPTRWTPGRDELRTCPRELATGRKLQLMQCRLTRCARTCAAEETVESFPWSHRTLPRLVEALLDRRQLRRRVGELLMIDGRARLIVRRAVVGCRDHLPTRDASELSVVECLQHVRSHRNARAAFEARDLCNRECAQAVFAS
jgi:hypothetical protein